MPASFVDYYIGKIFSKDAKLVVICTEPNELLVIIFLMTVDKIMKENKKKQNKTNNPN